MVRTGVRGQEAEIRSQKGRSLQKLLICNKTEKKSQSLMARVLSFPCGACGFWHHQYPYFFPPISRLIQSYLLDFRPQHPLSFSSSSQRPHKLDEKASLPCLI